MASQISILSILSFVFPYLLRTISSSDLSNYPAVFNFGDSNSDTGGLAAGIAFPVGHPNGQTFFLKPSGRFCDGRLIVDFLSNVLFFVYRGKCTSHHVVYGIVQSYKQKVYQTQELSTTVDAMKLPFLNPYLESVGAPTFHTGCNFATGGSTALPATAYSVSPFSLNLQVAQFLRFKTRVLELLAKDKKLQKYLPQEDYFKKGLYMFDIGQNDLDGLFYSKTEDQVLAFVPNILSEIESALKELYQEGARNFWVHNTSPLGCLPRIIAIYGKDPSQLDQNGCVSSHNKAAKQFNVQLHDLCTKFIEQFPEATVTYVDIFSVKSNLISNFSQYGFKQNVAACCGYGGLPLNFDNRIACGETKNLNGSLVSAKPCTNTTEYVNWDGNHYTESANQFVFAQILSGNYSQNLVDTTLLERSTSFQSELETWY